MQPFNDFKGILKVSQRCNFKDSPEKLWWQTCQYQIISKIAIPSIINAAKQAQDNGSNGILVYCFGEPGVNDIKSIIKNIPVLGIASTSMYTASQLSKYWAVIAAVDTHCPLIQLLVDKFGLSSQFKATKSINISPDALLTEANKFYKSSVELIKETLYNDPSTNAFILGCGSMSQYADNLRNIRLLA